MQIHGVRIYPKSVSVVPGKGAPIFVHDRIDNDISDFFYIFRHTAPLWQNHLFVSDFGITYPSPPFKKVLADLQEQYGSSMIEADIKSQLLLLQGDDFLTWAAQFYTYEAAFLPILREVVPFSDLDSLYWKKNFQLTSETWPPFLRGVLHMWDDIYWQLFSTERSDIDFLIQSHASDANLAMYYVDFDKEYPDPSNERLKPVITSS